MKKIIIVLLITMISSCQFEKRINDYTGTWSKCNEYGEYFEWKIDKNRVVMLSLLEDDIALFESKINNHNLIIKGINVSLPKKIDTLSIVSKTEYTIVLKRSFRNQIFELKRIENNITEIDSANIENWKKMTISEFKKRAKLRKCPIIKKRKPIVNLNIYKKENMEVEIPIQN